MQEAPILNRMLGHDAWTTRRLLEIVATLTDEQLDHPHDIGHRTIRKTINHVLWNMECWTDLMRGGPVRERAADEASIASMIERLDAIAIELKSLAGQLVKDGRLNECYVDTLDSPPTEKSYAGTLLHIATHGMHHRAQLLYMLRLTGVRDLPEGDALSWERAAINKP